MCTYQSMAGIGVVVLYDCQTSAEYLVELHVLSGSVIVPNYQTTYQVPSMLQFTLGRVMI